MFSKLIRIALVAAFVATTAFATFAKETASYPYREIEVWRDQGMTFVVRDASGHFIHHAKGHLERWRNGEMTWVVRDADGKFLTRARGKFERWADGTFRLVLRNRDGKFVAMAIIAYAGERPQMLSERRVASDLASLD